MFSPCEKCCNNYKGDCEKYCNYAISIKLLKQVLLVNDCCAATCKHGYVDHVPTENGYDACLGWFCNKTSSECKDFSLYSIDHDKVNKKYGKL